jgi:hypothetical protein
VTDGILTTAYEYDGGGFVDLLWLPDKLFVPRGRCGLKRSTCL